MRGRVYDRQLGRLDVHLADVPAEDPDRGALPDRPLGRPPPLRRPRAARKAGSVRRRGRCTRITHARSCPGRLAAAPTASTGGRAPAGARERRRRPSGPPLSSPAASRPAARARRPIIKSEPPQPLTGEADDPRGRRPPPPTPAYGDDERGATLSVTDNRTGATYELPIRTGPSARWTSARSRPPRTTSA